MDKDEKKSLLPKIVFFTTLGSSFFLVGFSHTLTRWKKNEYRKTPNLLLEEGQELAMKALIKGSKLALFGCSAIFIAGFVIFQKTGFKFWQRDVHKENSGNKITTFQDLVNIIDS